MLSNFFSIALFESALCKFKFQHKTSLNLNQRTHSFSNLRHLLSNRYKNYTFLYATYTF